MGLRNLMDVVKMLLRNYSAGTMHSLSQSVGGLVQKKQLTEQAVGSLNTTTMLLKLIAHVETIRVTCKRNCSCLTGL